MTTEFKSWEELSPLEQAQATYSDMHKDAFGFRPRGIDTSNWTLEKFEEEFEDLGKIIDRAEQARKEHERNAVVAFEQRIIDLIEVGAKDRATAMKWIHQSVDTDGDDEYLAWILGLPYQYFKKVQPKTVDTI